MMKPARLTQKSFVRSLGIAIFIVMVVPPLLRIPNTVAAANSVEDSSSATEQIYLLVGRSAIIRTDRPILRVSLSTPEIADALVTSPRELLVHGKTPGTISLMIWADNGKITPYEVVVRRDLSPLEGQIHTQFPNEPITVASNGKDVVLSGVVSTKYIIDRAAALAVGYVDKPENVVNLMRQQENLATDQVLLKVRFAEVSRSALQELGASFFTGPNGKGDWIARGTSQQYPAPDFDRDKGLVFSDFLNLFAFNTKEQLGAAIKALEGKGLFQSLAEPNLITQDGKEASFLAGGEYPYPVVQSGQGTSSVTIVFKEFGVRLKFTPTVTSDEYIQLKVMPEVSTLDFSNAIILGGFRVPALSTRRTETQVELHDGQTFAIAGLLDRSVNETLRRVPGIGDIPILGYLFRSQAYQKNNTELVVMITPYIVRRDSPGVTPNLPGLVQPFLPPVNRTTPMPPPAFSNPAGQPQTIRPAVASNQPAARPATGTTAVAASPVRATASPASAAAPASATSMPAASASMPAATDMTMDSAPLDKKAQKELAVRQQDDMRRAVQQKKVDEIAARKEQERQRAAAKVDIQRQAQAAVVLSKAQKLDNERLMRERKVEEKRATEQAAIDRKRWIAQQAQAARDKEAADKQAKEQAKIDAVRQAEADRVAEKLRKAEEQKAKEEKEKADRDKELARLLEQYKKLTEGAECSRCQSGQSGR